MERSQEQERALAKLERTFSEINRTIEASNCFDMDQQTILMDAFREIEMLFEDIMA